MAYKKKKKGVPIGFKNNWNYKERKYTSDGKNFTIIQSKRRNSSAPKRSEMPLKSKLTWGITGKERIGEGKYIKGYGWMTPIKMWGIKRQRKYKLPKRKWK